MKTMNVKEMYQANQSPIQLCGDDELPTGGFRGDDKLPTGGFRTNINSGYNDRVSKYEPSGKGKKKQTATDKTVADVKDKVHKILSR